jgi:hypothetical protein
MTAVLWQPNKQILRYAQDDNVVVATAADQRSAVQPRRLHLHEPFFAV